MPPAPILQRLVPGESLENLQQWNATHFAEEREALLEGKRRRAASLAGAAYVAQDVSRTPLPREEEVQVGWQGRYTGWPFRGLLNSGEIST